MPRKVSKKVCVLGDGAVGKTCLIRRFVEDMFEEGYTPTVGTKIMRKVVAVGDTELTMTIWDIMGHKSHQQVPAAYYSGAEGVLAVCDLTRPETLKNLDYWLESLALSIGPVALYILGNKIDLQDKIAISADDLKSVAENAKGNYAVTSAKTGINVEEAFGALARRMLAKKMY